MKRYLLIVAFTLSGMVYAQYPPGYYDSAAGLYGLPLQIALHNIIDGHTEISYDSLFKYFTSTDAKPGNVVWDMYSDVPGGTPPYVYHYNSGQECGNYNSEGDCYNREHSWPKSWFGGEIPPMFSDLFHLYPTDGYVNNRRANYPFGPVSSASWVSLNGSRVGACSWPGYTGTVFEPIDEYKGDFARTYFYMSVRYYGEDAGWPGNDMTTGAQLKPWARALMLQWSAQDTVSQKEIDRNNAIYLVQNNRNPFIDNPHWAIDIWGPGAGINNERPQNGELQVLPTPAHDECRVVIPANSGDAAYSVNVYTTSGSLVSSIENQKGSKLVLHLDGIPPGMFLARITAKDGSFAYLARVVKW